MVEATCFGMVLDPYTYGLLMELGILILIPVVVGLVGLTTGWLKW